MIPIDRLLDGLDVVVDSLVVYDLRQPGRPVGPSRTTVFYVPSGESTLELIGGAVLHFSRDLLSILPAPRKANGPRSAVPEGMEANGGTTVLATGRIGATYLGSVGFFDNLREPLIESLAAGDPLRRCFKDLLKEIAAPRPGFRPMVESLLRQCLILLLRRHAAGNGRSLPWLAGLEDEGVGRALAAMRDRPEQTFTLHSLAAVAGMSRSVFAVRFAEALDESPMVFLKRLRLIRAAQLLTRTDLPVKTVAGRVGYSSRSSFTRAFLAGHHVGPTAFRDSAREAQSLAHPPAEGAQKRGPRSRKGALHEGRKRSRRKKDASG